ncbi:MAG: CHASE2 domain-containing serine/threonine-protein kinase [Desulfosudaceae bacterium]
MNLIKKNPTLFFGLLLTLLFLILTQVRVGFFDTLGLKLYDTWMKLDTPAETEGRIVIVEIDDDSIEKIGRWPWPRSFIARGIDQIAAAGPAVIGLNIIYSEAEENAGLQAIEHLEKLFTDTFPARGNTSPTDAGITVSDLPGSPPAPPPRAAYLAAMRDAKNKLDRDSILAAAMRRADNVVLPVFFMDSDRPGADTGTVAPALASQAIAAENSDLGGWCPSADEATLPLPLFHEAASGLGHINCAPDQDGTFRRERLFYQYNDLYIPSYSLVIAASYLNVTPDNIRARIGSRLHIRDAVIPLTIASEMLIPFMEPQDGFKHYSFFDVINDKIPSRIFTNKIVLLSPSAKGLATSLSTPVAAGMPLGDFCANVIGAIVNNRFIRQMPLGDLFEPAFILLLGLLIALLLPRLRALWAGMAFSVILLLLIGGSAWLFLARGMWLPVTYPLLMLVIGYIGIISINYFSAEASREKLAGESAQTNRMLGISFQSQGMLDMAFDKFRKVPVDDEMKDILYNLALDYERKRQFNKAASVYGYIEGHDPGFKDVSDRKVKLNQASESMVFGGSLGGPVDDMTTTGSGVRPMLGRYEIIKQLGKGAMGTVYLGQDPRINRTTAIKTVRFSDDFDEEEAKEMKAKFFREAESAGTLSHPNIVTIYDAGDEQDIAYIAMEYLEGEDLEKYTKKSSLLPARRVIAYMADVAEALDYAHQKGIVHRDIKPANIMLVQENKIKITDFGIARITASSQTKTGIIKGTPYYMSPEQISGKKVDGRSDIFSMGTMMFQLLTGTVPFKGSSPAELMHKILNEPHPDPRKFAPRLPKALVAIINKALAKDIAKRYQTAGQMAGHLRTLGEKIDAARNR